MGPDQASWVSFTRQGVRRQGRPRICLLKGCERHFVPSHPLQRYCCDDCRNKVREWWLWKSQRDYRRSERGKEMRRAQNKRRRARLKENGLGGQKDADGEACEGHHKAGNSIFFSCDRPGCYELFRPTARSPRKRFCSCGCRQALRRVVLREKYNRNRRRKLKPCVGKIAASFLTHIDDVKSRR